MAATLMAVGCGSSQDSAEPSVGAGALSTQKDALVKDGLSRALRVVSTCGKHGGGSLDPRCVETAARAPSSASIRAKVDKVTHGQICSALGAAGGGRLYYLQGVVNAGDEGVPTAIERVWDLTVGQAATFATRAGGVGGRFTGDVDGYAGFARGKVDNDVATVWRGRTVSGGGAFGRSPMADATTSFADARDEIEGVAGRVPASESLSKLSFSLSTIELPESFDGATYLPLDAQSRAMHVYEPAEADSGAFVAIKGNSVLDEGTALAVHILQSSDAQAGSFAAAVAALALRLDVDPATFCAGSGLSVRSLRPQAGNDGGEAIDDLDPFDAPAMTNESGSDKACSAAPDGCDGLFPGRNLVCTEDGAGSQCCRPQFTPSGVCYADEDCKTPGQICVLADKASSRFSCIDPAAPATACQGGGPRQAIPRATSEITLAAFIPCSSLGSRLTGCFTGDNRSYSNDTDVSMTRSRLAARVKVDENQGVDQQTYIGATHSVSCGFTAAHNDSCTALQSPNDVKECGRATGTVTTSANWVGERAKIRIRFSSRNPCVTGAPAIDGGVDVFISYAQQNGKRVPRGYTWSGDHDKFPSWELYINGDGKHGFDPQDGGFTPLALVRTVTAPMLFSGEAGH